MRGPVDLAPSASPPATSCHSPGFLKCPAWNFLGGGGKKAFNPGSESCRPVRSPPWSTPPLIGARGWPGAPGLALTTLCTTVATRETNQRSLPPRRVVQSEVLFIPTPAVSDEGVVSPPSLE